MKLLIFIALLCLSLFVAGQNVRQAVVINNNVSLRAQASGKSDVVSILKLGTTVAVYRQKGVWFLSETEDTTVGWVHGNDIKFADRNNSESSTGNLIRQDKPTESVSAPLVLPLDYQYKKGIGEQSGVPFYTLNLKDTALASRTFSPLTEFQFIGAIAQPERGIIGLNYVSNRSDMRALPDEGNVEIILDGKPLPALRYQRPPNMPALLDALAIRITLAVLSEIASAKEAVIRFGQIGYSLDRDNLTALRFFTSTMTEDLQTRAK